MKTGYQNKRDGEIKEEFNALCDAIRRQVGDELRQLTERYVLSEEEMKEAISSDEPMYDDYEIRRYLGEVGCPICRDGDRIFLGELSHPETGAGCRIKEGSCQRMGGTYIGSFHTHPIGGNTPSVADIECGIRQEEEIMCIGGNVGDEYKVTCYTPRAIVRKRGLIYNPMGGRYYPQEDDIPATGEIEFFRETPPPTAEDVLDAIGNNDEEIVRLITMYHGIDEDDPDVEELVEDFRNTLKDGKIPDEYWEGRQEVEGEFDTLELYTGDSLREIEKRRRAFLQRDVYLCDLI